MLFHELVYKQDVSIIYNIYIYFHPEENLRKLVKEKSRCFRGGSGEKYANRKHEMKGAGTQRNWV